ARRARRQLWPWLVGGGLAVSAVAIGAIFLGPRHLTGVGPAASARLEAEPSTSAESPEPNATTRVVESPQREPAQPSAAVPQPDAPPADTRPMLATPPNAPGRPLPGFVPETPASSDESARQRRRRARAELRAAAPQLSPREGSAEPPPPIEPPQTGAQPSADTPLRIEMIVWAPEPGARMVYVNGHRYVEGQTLENGAVLREIQPDAIIVLQRGQPFRLRSESR
ncbi:MAG TPA: general secretion pathway protein GspB, partial [Methylomirabilota bacterium]|nr:general secretion pathway protein GspB [Methylomirabilota bacterium]